MSKEKGKLIQDDLIHFSLVEDDGSALCWEGDACPEVPPIISTEIREVTCTECQKHYDTLNDLNRALGGKGKLIESPESRQSVIDAAEQYADRFPANRRLVSIDAFVAGAKFAEAEAPRQPSTDLWPKDLTICPKCKRDTLSSRHELDWFGEIVCLREVSQHPVPAPQTSHRTWTEVKAEMDSKGEHPVPAPEQLAQRFHETYERLAPNFGYRLREGFDVPWADVPENNRQLMTAVCAEILEGEHPEPVPFNAEKSLRNMFESLKAGHPKPAKEVTMAERECAREVIAFILAVLQNCEITDAAEAEVAAIIRKHAAANVKGLTDTAEKLLEWMPIYSKGSSGNIRQTNLRAAIEKFKVEHPGPAKGGGE